MYGGGEVNCAAVPHDQRPDRLAAQRARLMPPIRGGAAAALSRSPRARRAPTSSATATASSIPPPSAGSRTRPRSSSSDEGDHYRTRLTHTLEVAQIARALARALGLDEDLAEALALAHDLGHPPFGHAGERALDAAMADFGGFDHNAQSLRVVTALERRYPRFDGLNLTWETLEGLVKHNGPLTDAEGTPIGRYARAASRSRSSTTPAGTTLNSVDPCRRRGAGRGDRRRHRLRRARYRRRAARRAVHARRPGGRAADRRASSREIDDAISGPRRGRG